MLAECATCELITWQQDRSSRKAFNLDLVLVDALLTIARSVGDEPWAEDADLEEDTWVDGRRVAVLADETERDGALVSCSVN